MRVGDEYRTSELSLIPGGYTVVVTYNSGKVLEYDKIKKPNAYIRMVMNKPDVKSAVVKK